MTSTKQNLILQKAVGLVSFIFFSFFTISTSNGVIPIVFKPVSLLMLFGWLIMAAMAILGLFIFLKKEIIGVKLLIPFIVILFVGLSFFALPIWQALGLAR
jgi:hypothetical protein